MRKRYIATGLVLCADHAKNKTVFETVEVESTSMVDLKMKMCRMLLEDKLFPVKSSLLIEVGAVYRVVEKTYLEIDDETFVSEKYYIDYVGFLSPEQIEDLQSQILFKLNPVTDF